jgi:hypothetical protein
VAFQKAGADRVTLHTDPVPGWGKTEGKIGFHGGKVEMARPRLRGFDGKEQALPSWEAAQNAIAYDPIP